MRLGIVAFVVNAGFASATAAQQIVVVLPDSLSTTAWSRAVERGVEFGWAETRHTTGLLGRNLALKTIRVSGAAPGDEVVSWTSGAVAVIGGFDDDALQALARLPLPVLNVGRPPDSSAVAGCNVFHLLADGAIASSARGDNPAAAGVVAWHPSLARYGAEQLNRRFEERYGVRMDAGGWVGWFAIKVVAEALLRGKPTDLMTTLRVLRFDGHKGRALRFGADGRLLQPVYAVSDDQHVLFEMAAPLAANGRADAPARRCDN